MIAAVIAVVTVGIIAFAIAVIAAVVKGVWKVIKKVTGFTWSTFVSVVKNPTFWSYLTVFSAGVAVGGAVANPLVAAVACAFTAVGVVGTLATR